MSENYNELIDRIKKQIEKPVKKYGFCSDKIEEDKVWTKARRLEWKKMYDESAQAILKKYGNK